MRSQENNSVSSEAYWDEYSDESESSIERHRDPKHSRRMMTHKYRGSQQSSREVLPNLLIRHKGSQRIYVSLNR
jgi:hypothetical protein